MVNSLDHWQLKAVGFIHMLNLDKAKQIAAKRLSFRQDKPLDPEDVKVAREYIAKYWKKLERFHPKDDESLLGVPKPYLVPSYDA